MACILSAARDMRPLVRHRGEDQSYHQYHPLTCNRNRALLREVYYSGDVLKLHIVSLRCYYPLSIRFVQTLIDII